MTLSISLLNGDGSGSQLIETVVEILGAIGIKYQHKFKYLEASIGGAAINRTGVPFPQEAIDRCKKNEAIIIGSIGGAEYLDEHGIEYTKKSVDKLLSSIKVYASITPIISYPKLLSHSPFKRATTKKTNIYVVSDLASGVFGGDRGYKNSARLGQQAYDTELLSLNNIQQVAQLAFELCATKKLPMTSVDMADRTESGLLWRKTIRKLSNAYPNIQLQHMLWQDCINKLNTHPQSLGVVLTNGLIGQMLTAQGATILGKDSIGTCHIGLNNISVYGSHRFDNQGDNPNPIGIISACAMMMSMTFGKFKEAYTIERALRQTIKGYIPQALGGNASCTKFTKEVVHHIINS